MNQSFVDDIMSQTTAKRCLHTVEALRKRGFKATFCETVGDAIPLILQEATQAQTIGFGGSLSIAPMRLEETFTAKGKTILNHGKPDLTPEERMTIMRQQLTCDLFLSGTNALTTSGILVNVDCNGNRVAAMTFGPQSVMIIAGRNKLVEGNINDACEFIQTRAAPANAIRLNRKTPCSQTGFCSHCISSESICRITTILEQCPPRTNIHVLVINQDLGL